MRREAQLDRLLEQQSLGMVQLPALDADDAAKLAAAETFARLNAIEIPSDVAQRIEARVRNRAAALQMTGQNASPRRSPLREVSRRPVMRRAWIVALAVVVILLLTSVGITTVAANSLPGDALYGIKQLEQHIALAWAGDQNARAALQLTQLQQAMADLNTVVHERRSDAAIQDALAAITADTQASQNIVHALPAGQPREALAHSLANTLQGEHQMLHHLLSQVDWEEQLTFTRQLGALGEPIPTIARVTMVESAGETLVITVTGNNFAPGTRLVIDGSPRGVVLSNTSTTLRVQVHASDLPQHNAYTIGVSNPDGTAAQSGLVRTPDHHDQPGPGDHHSTPGPPHGNTPEPGGGEYPPMPGDMHGGHS